MRRLRRRENNLRAAAAPSAPVDVLSPLDANLRWRVAQVYLSARATAREPLSQEFVCSVRLLGILDVALVLAARLQKNLRPYFYGEPIKTNFDSLKIGDSDDYFPT